jgi:transcriptional regulator with XRE-family HTH domain
MAQRTQEKAADKLTRHQRTRVRELDEIADLLGLDYQNINEYEKEGRTPHLERIKRHLIIGEVVRRYTLIDESLNMRLCDYFFGRKRSYIRLWKTKRFRLFNYYIIEELTLMAKLRFVKSVSKVPKAVAADIERLNALRNGLAHAFFPENLKKSRPEWKGKSIFAVDGLRAFIEDMSKADGYFFAVPPILDNEQ